MNKFLEYLNELAVTPEREPTGRHYTNALGIQEIIILPQNYWVYVDWLVARGIDFEEWVVECDKHRGETPLSAHMMHWLWWDQCERHREGSETPADLPPIGYRES